MDGFLPSTPTVKTASARLYERGSPQARVRTNVSCQHIRESLRPCIDTDRADSGPRERGIRGGRLGGVLM
jgi:hypothetical protein